MDFISQAFETHSKVPECQMPLTASVMCLPDIKMNEYLTAPLALFGHEGK